MRSRIPIAVLSATLLSLAACGSDTNPTTPSRASVPDVSGGYYVSWTLQVLRLSDNFQTSFSCSGRVTLTQQPNDPTLAGFVVADSPCEPVSFGLTGTVQPGGGISFLTSGPRPLEGPCPGGTNISFSGEIENRSFHARGATSVQCPQFGEHLFTYLLDGYHE